MSLFKHSDKVVIKLPERLISNNSREIYKEIKSNLNKGKHHFIIDGINLSFIDSMAIGMLVKTLKEVQKSGGSMVLDNLHGYPENLINETGIGALFKSSDSDITDDIETLKNFNISTESINDVCIVNLSGSMTYPDGTKLFKEKILVCMESQKTFVLNMEKLRFLDSSSIGELLHINTLLKQTECILKICGLKGLVKEYFENLSITRLFHIYNSVNDAIEAK